MVCTIISILLRGKLALWWTLFLNGRLEFNAWWPRSSARDLSLSAKLPQKAGSPRVTQAAPVLRSCPPNGGTHPVDLHLCWPNRKGPGPLERAEGCGLDVGCRGCRVGVGWGGLPPTTHDPILEPLPGRSFSPLGGSASRRVARIAVSNPSRGSAFSSSALARRPARGRPAGEAHRTLPPPFGAPCRRPGERALKGGRRFCEGSGRCEGSWAPGWGWGQVASTLCGGEGSRAAAGGRPSRFPLLPALLDPREGVGTAAGRTRRCRPQRAEPGGCVFSAVSKRSPPRQEARRWEWGGKV